MKHFITLSDHQSQPASENGGASKVRRSVKPLGRRLRFMIRLRVSCFLNTPPLTSRASSLIKSISSRFARPAIGMVAFCKVIPFHILTSFFIDNYKNGGGVFSYDRSRCVVGCKSSEEVFSYKRRRGVIGFLESSRVFICLKSGYVFSCTWSGGILRSKRYLSPLKARRYI